MASFEVRLVLEYENETQKKITGHVFLKDPYDNEELFEQVTELVNSVPSLNEDEIKCIFATLVIGKEEVVYMKIEEEYYDELERAVECNVIIPEKVTIH
jgi:hypothetical protein